MGEFLLLQNPTKKYRAQSYIFNRKNIVKGPYELKDAENILQKYTRLSELEPSQHVPDLKFIKGPVNFKLIEFETGWFFESPVFAEDLQIRFQQVTRKDQVVINIAKINVKSPDPLNDSDEICIKLIKAGIVRAVLGIGDPAWRNFIVYNDNIIQIDLDDEKKSDRDTTIRYIFPNCSQKVQERFQELFKSSEIQEYLNNLFLKLTSDEKMRFCKIQRDFLSVELEPIYKDLLGNFVIPPLDFDIYETAGMFITAFMAMYDAGFGLAKENSLQHVITSVYTALVEDIDVADIMRIGPDVVYLLESLKKVVKKERTLEMDECAFEVGAEIYNLLSGSVKTRELSLWKTTLINPYSTLHHYFDPEIIKIQNPKMSDIKSRDAPDWMQKLFKRLSGENRILVLLLSCYNCEPSPEPSNNFKKMNWSTMFVKGAHHTVVKQGRTFITKFPSINQWVAKSIMQKAIRIGHPAEFEGFEDFTFWELIMDIPTHYTHDKHVSKKYDYLDFLISGIRSNNARDIIVDGVNLFASVQEIYLKMYQEGLKPGSKTFRELMSRTICN